VAAHGAEVTPPSAPAGFRAHVQRLFTVALPAPFERVRHEDAGRPERKEGENVVRFEDERGRFLLVLFDPVGSGFAADSVWRVAPNEAGDGLRLVAEEARCRRPRYGSSSQAVAEDVDECPEGDGKLLVAATAELRGHRFVFFFGDALHEEGVDLAPFRATLATFRVR
jgi:hypothetical protein